VNLLGCVLFMISALAAFVVPDTGSILDLAAANWTTSLGAVCFLIGAIMAYPRERAARVADGRDAGI
jgi:threonine/homoserine/homoserine lactone efflux protein